MSGVCGRALSSDTYKLIPVVSNVLDAWVACEFRVSSGVLDRVWGEREREDGKVGQSKHVPDGGNQTTWGFSSLPPAVRPSVLVSCPSFIRTLFKRDSRRHGKSALRSRRHTRACRVFPVVRVYPFCEVGRVSPLPAGDGGCGGGVDVGRSCVTEAFSLHPVAARTTAWKARYGPFPRLFSRFMRSAWCRDTS